MVTAVDGDVDRHVADHPHVPLGRVRAEREPLALEAHLLLERAVARECRPVVGPVPSRVAERPHLARCHPRLRVREQAAPRRERRRGGVWRAELVGRVERQHLPPPRARRREPVDEGAAPRPRAGRPAARSDGAERRLTAPTARRTVYRVAVVAAERITIADVTPRSTAGAGPRRPASATRSRSRRRSSATATSRSAPSFATASRAAAGARQPLVAARERPLRRLVRGRHGRAASVRDRGLGRPPRGLARRARPQGRGRAGGPRGRARRGRGAVRRGAGRRLARGRAGLGASDRHGPPGAQPLELDVERERARFGAWYELFPRSWGGFAGVSQLVPELAALGFDVVYLPPIHPIGETNRKGRNNAERAKPGRCRQPVGDRRGRGRARRDPPGARHARRLRGARRGAARARDRARARLRDPDARPTIPGSREHPEWFQHRPDGSLKYAENPPKRYQDIHNFDWDTR